MHKNKIQLLAKRIEFYTAISNVGRAVINKLENLAQLNEIETQEINICRQFYQERSNTAKHRLEYIIKKSPDESKIIFKKMVNNAAITAEKDTINELTEYSGLPEKLKLKLNKEFEDI